MSLLFSSKMIARLMLQQRTSRSVAKRSEKCPTIPTNGHGFDLRVAGDVTSFNGRNELWAAVGHCGAIDQDCSLEGLCAGVLSGSPIKCRRAIATS